MIHKSGATNLKDELMVWNFVINIGDMRLMDLRPIGRPTVSFRVMVGTIITIIIMNQITIIAITLLLHLWSLFLSTLLRN